MAVTIQATQTDSERQFPDEGRKRGRSVAPVETPVDAPVAKPLIVVMATMLGTYPDPGSVKAVSRAPGDKFVLSDEKHFSRVWMKRLGPGDDATVPIPVRNIPQTTAPVLKKASPFPPQPS